MSAQSTETVCGAGLVVGSGESCTYPGTTVQFSVTSSGRGRFLFFTSGTSIEIKDSTINGVVYNFVAKSQRDGTWLIETAGDSVAATPTATPTPTATATPTPTEDGECRSGLVVGSGESCMYPGTAAEFSVDASGRGRFLFFTSGTSIEIKDSTINGVVYNFVAKSQRDGTWLIETAGDSVTPTPTATPTGDGADQVPSVPANQRYQYDGSSIVLSWDASAEATSYTIYYDDFFGSSRRISFDRPSFCDELATALTTTSYTHADPDESRNYYWVVACNSAGCSEIDSANPARLGGAPPAAPANQTYEYDGASVVLSWDASADATSYTVYYDDFFGASCRISFGSPSFCEELATDLTGTTFTHTDPDASRNYYWVVACNNYGCSEIDSSNPAGLGGAPPAAPANQSYEYNGSSIVLSWDASAGATSYTVYYDDFFGSSCSISFGSPSFCEELATDLTVTSYAHTEPDASRNYYWVVACNSFGCSEIDSASPAQLGGDPPPAPANQRYEYDGSSIVLNWDASTDAASYTVYYHDFFGSSCRISFGSPSFCDELATGLSDTSYTHADPDASRNYSWVVACNSFGCSEIDSANPARLGGAPPASPANQRYEHEGSSVVLSWEASPDAASYTVYYDDFFGSSCRISFGSPSFCEELATSLTTTNYTHGAPNSSRNYYWVVACNSFGCSEIDSGFPARLIGTVPPVSSGAHVGSLDTGEEASVEGRILARRLGSGRVEFGFQPEGEALTLPARRFFPADARVDHWLVSSDVVSGEDLVGRITARLRASGRIEFGFNPVEGERVLPRARFFPTTAREDQWLRSTIIEVPLPPETTTLPASPQSERDALVALYNATNGAHWRERTNWVSDAPLGTWYGVTTDGNGHVTGLDLSENELKGAIPPDLAKLEQLEALYLNDNQLSGAIPAELGDLTNLVRLLLAGNELSGAIPDELGNLASLKLLLLGENKLSGKVPPAMGKLASLNVLALQANELSGEIPPEVGDLTNLEILFLYENELSGEVPPELGKLSNLQVLALHDNQLSGTLPDTLGDLANLVAAAVCELNPDLVCNLAELVADTVLIGVDAVFSTVAAVGGLLGDIGGVVRDVGSAIIGILGGWW